MGPARGLVVFLKCWSVVRCRSYHGVGGVRDDEAQVSQGASAQVCFDCPRVRLKKLTGGVDCLIVRLTLNCWEYCASKSCHNILDGGVLHLYVLGGPECLSVLLMRKRFWTGVPKKTVVLIVGYSIG
jgi:hypothetical protein